MNMEEEVFITNEQLEFLDTLRLSGRTNMYDSVRFLREEWPELQEFEARSVLVYWMKTFTQRNKSKGGKK